MPSGQAINNQEQIKAIRRSLMAGQITYPEAAELAAPVIKRINEQGKAIAKKHGLRPKLITFSEIMR